MRFSQKFLHIYEKYRTFRIGFGVTVGLFIGMNFLVIYPGNKLLLQRQAKQFTAKTVLQFLYLSKKYTEGAFLGSVSSWESAMEKADYITHRFRADVVLK